MTDEIFEASLTDEVLSLMRESSVVTGPDASAYGVYGESIVKMKAPRFDLDRVWKLMDGLVDVHCHSGPAATTHRLYDVLDMAKQASKVGQRALVSKAHNVPTTRDAIVAQKCHNEWAAANNKKRVDLFGGVVLNYAVGGLNPDAVVSAYRLGGKYVWLPNLDAAHHRRVVGAEGGIELLDENDKVVPELKEILSLIAEGDMTLGVGHNSTKERFAVVDEAVKIGVKRIEVNHVNFPLTRMTPEQAKTIASKGALVGIYVMEFQPPLFYLEEALDIIRVVGPEHIVIASDCGHFQMPPPVESLRLMITELLLHGIPDKDVEKMVKTNPATLVY